MRAQCRILSALAAGAVLLAGCSAEESGARPGDETSASAEGAPSDSPTPTPSDDAVDEEATPEPEPETLPCTNSTESPPVRPVSVLGLAEQRHRGDRLRLGAVRERTPAYTSYDVTYRSRSTTRSGEESYTISGVLNVPNGRGAFPAAGHGAR